MAELHKLTKNGQTIYPATTTDAVVHPEIQAPLTDLINEYNVSVLYPTGGLDNTDKYNLATAVAKLDSMLNSSQKTIGTKLAFMSNDNELMEYTFTSGSFNNTSSWSRFDVNDINSKLTELSSKIVKIDAIATSGKNLQPGNYFINPSLTSLMKVIVPGKKSEEIELKKDAIYIYGIKFYTFNGEKLTNVSKNEILQNDFSVIFTSGNLNSNGEYIESDKRLYSEKITGPFYIELQQGYIIEGILVFEDDINTIVVGKNTYEYTLDNDVVVKIMKSDGSIINESDSFIKNIYVGDKYSLYKYINKIEDYINENIEPLFNPLVAYPTFQTNVISGIWAFDAQYLSFIMPIPESASIELSNNEKNISYTLLKTNNVSKGESPDFADGYTDRVILNKGVVEKIKSPSDAKYLWVYIGTDMSYPTTIKVDGYDFTKTIYQQNKQDDFIQLGSFSYNTGKVQESKKNAVTGELSELPIFAEVSGSYKIVKAWFFNEDGDFSNELIDDKEVKIFKFPDGKNILRLQIANDDTSLDVNLHEINLSVKTGNEVICQILSDMTIIRGTNGGLYQLMIDESGSVPKIKIFNLQ